MPQYVAIIEDAGPDEAVGLWFPDLPGCISDGDDVDEVLENAPRPSLSMRRSCARTAARFRRRGHWTSSRPTRNSSTIFGSTPPS